MLVWESRLPSLAPLFCTSLPWGCACVPYVGGLPSSEGSISVLRKHRDCGKGLVPACGRNAGQGRVKGTAWEKTKSESKLCDKQVWANSRTLRLGQPSSIFRVPAIRIKVPEYYSAPKRNESLFKATI